MKAQKLLIAGFAAVVLLLFVAQSDSYARLNGDENNVIREGKRIYEQPLDDRTLPFVKGVPGDDDAFPFKKRFRSPVIPEFLSRWLEVAVIGYREFRDSIRPVKYQDHLEIDY